MTLKSKLLSFLIAIRMIHGESSWYEQKLEGWYYFEEQNKTEDSPPVRSLDEAEELVELENRMLKKLLALALINPTESNVENYIRSQKRWIDQSAQFAATWEKVLLEKPVLGDFLVNPTTGYGIIEKRDFELNQRKLFLQETSKTHFLLFFFRGNDPFSEKAAEVAMLFANINQWKIRAVSLDGAGIKIIPSYEIDKGISQNIGVQSTPSFYVIDPSENRVVPVGAGLISVSDLEKNIELQLKGSQ